MWGTAEVCHSLAQSFFGAEPLKCLERVVRVCRMTVLDEFVRTNFDLDAEAIGPLKQVLVLDPGLFIVPLHERPGQVIAQDTTKG